MLAVLPAGAMAGAAGYQRLWMAAGNQAGRMREVASVLEICGDFVHPDPPTNAEDCCRRIPNGEPAVAHNILAKPNQVGLLFPREWI